MSAAGRTTVGILFAILVSLGAPMATAGSSQYGTLVKVGDADYVPTAKAASRAVSVNEQDFGGSGRAIDGCLLLDTASTAAAGAQPKDIRLTPCVGKEAGTQIKVEDSYETQTTYAQVTGDNLQYADQNLNGKYDAGEAVYITTQASGLAATGATGTWTVRLTPVDSYPAGSFVLSGDVDYADWNSLTVAFASSVVERDDGQWFVVPVAAAGVAKYGPIPATSIKLSNAPPAVDIKATTVKVDPATPAAGGAFQVTIDLKNGGKFGGSTLLASKLNNVMIDSRPTPHVVPSGTAQMVLTLLGPSAPGTFVLEIGTVKSNVTFREDPRDALIRQLEARIGVLEGQVAGVGAAAEKVEIIDDSSSGAESPGLDALVILVLLGAIVVRRVRRERGQ